MFVSAIKRVEKAMFPIFCEEDIGNGQSNVGFLGTGFFIDKMGTFVTCAHLFDGVTAGARLTYRGRAPDAPHNPTVPIRELYRTDQQDIFIGSIEVSPASFLTLARSPCDAGRFLCVAGYPLAELKTGAGGALDFSGIRRYYQPSLVIDRAQVPARCGRLHNGFIMANVTYFGMSGGPVFDTGAAVIGMQAAVVTRESTNGAQKIVVQNGVAVGSDLIHAAVDAWRRKGDAKEAG